MKGGDRWREVIRFYVGLAEKPYELVEWLQRDFGWMGEDDKRRFDDILAAAVEAFPGADLAAKNGYVPSPLS
jgi:hypothetical protein